MMTPSPASISAAWNEWQALGGPDAPMHIMETMGKVIKAAFARMEQDGYVMCRAYEEDPPRDRTGLFLTSVDFEGTTRALGSAQGFHPLFIADMGLPMGDDRMQPIMVSIWEIDPNDIPLIVAGHGIQFSMYGTDHPPVLLQVTADPVNAEDVME